MRDVTDRVRAAARAPDLPVFVLLASPEIEAWLLADLSNSFAHPRYLKSHFAPPPSEQDLRLALDLRGPCRPEDTWESYGCPPNEGGTACTHKLSVDLADTLDGLEGRMRSYSKRRDGAAMLKRIEPDQVTAACPLYAAPVILQLRSWAERR